VHDLDGQLPVQYPVVQLLDAADPPARDLVAEKKSLLHIPERGGQQLVHLLWDFPLLDHHRLATFPIAFASASRALCGVGTVWLLVLVR